MTSPPVNFPRVNGLLLQLFPCDSVTLAHKPDIFIRWPVSKQPKHGVNIESKRFHFPALHKLVLSPVCLGRAEGMSALSRPGTAPLWRGIYRLPQSPGPGTGVYRDTAQGRVVEKTCQGLLSSRLSLPGQAVVDGCSKFGPGHEDVFKTLLGLADPGGLTDSVMCVIG